MKDSRLIGNLMLTGAALIWGCAFVAQSVGMDYMGPFTFQTVRSFIGALSLLPVIAFRRRSAARQGSSAALTTRERKTLLWGGALCGLIVAVATGLQQVALVHSSAGKAGFLTALYIILVPLAGHLMGRKARPLLWLCVLVAAAGLYLLTIRGGFTIAPSDLLLILCAVVFTGHILVVDHISPQVPGMELCALQFFICGLISAVPMLLFETPRLSQLTSGWLPLLYAGILSSGVAYTLQILGRSAPPHRGLAADEPGSGVAVLAGWCWADAEPSGSPRLPDDVRRHPACAAGRNARQRFRLPGPPQQG